MSILKSIPEYYLVVLFVLAGYNPPFSINPFAIILAIIIVLQIIFRFQATGVIIAILFMLVNVFMLFALISEFNEFTAFNLAAKQLLFIGIPLFLLNMVIGILLLQKYAFQKIKV